VSFITTILPLSLEQYLAKNLEDKQLPVAFTLSEQALTLAGIASCEPAKKAQIELVVFQELSLLQLVALQKHAQFEITTLTTINHRNNQTSCRFQVNCDDFIKTRKAVADFALANKIEAALLTDVPKLAVPGLLVMDMDSTTIEIECIDEIAKLAGVGEEVAEVTERAMLGELDFAQSLHQRVAT